MKDINVRPSEIKDWRKKLNKQLVNSINDINPEKISFFYSEDEVVICVITTKEGYAVGITIKSPIDDFDEKQGRNKAAGRALKAHVNKENDESIRIEWDDFPKNWTKRRIDFLKNFAYVFFYKSVWIDKTKSLPDFLTTE